MGKISFQLLCHTVCFVIFFGCNSQLEDNGENSVAGEGRLSPSSGLSLSTGNGFGSEGEFGANALRRAFPQNEVCEIFYSVESDITSPGVPSEEEIEFIPEVVFSPSSLGSDGHTYNNYTIAAEDCGHEKRVESEVSSSEIKELPYTKILADGRLILNSGLKSYRGRFYADEGAPEAVCFLKDPSLYEYALFIEVYDLDTAIITLTNPRERDFSYRRKEDLSVNLNIEASLYSFSSSDNNFLLQFEKLTNEEEMLNNTYMSGTISINYFDEFNRTQELSDIELNCLADIQKVFGVERWSL